MPQLHFTDGKCSSSPTRFGRADRRPVLVGGPLIPQAVRNSSTAPHSYLATTAAMISSSTGSFENVRSLASGPPTASGRMPVSLVTWARFLAERRGGKNVWKADRQDVIAFHRTRRLTVGPGQIAGASWNRSITVLETILWLGLGRGSRGEDTVFPQMTATPAAMVARYAQRRSPFVP